MGWSLDLKTGHCQLGSLTVLVDPRLTSSGGIRCVGPFDPSRAQDETKTRSEMSHLMNELEQITGGYVVWGTHSLDLISKQKSATFLGVECTFRSCLLVRTEIALDQRITSPGREWFLRENSIVHSAGFSINLNSKDVTVESLDEKIVDVSNLDQCAQYFSSKADAISDSLAQELRKRA